MTGHLGRVARLIVGAGLLALAALAAPLAVAAADGGPLDPQAAQAILQSCLTLAGGTIAATIIATVIQLAKGIPNFGTWLDAGHEYVVNLVLSAALIVYAAVATGYVLDAVSGFGLFLAWLGLSAIVVQSNAKVINPAAAAINPGG